MKIIFIEPRSVHAQKEVLCYGSTGLRNNSNWGVTSIEVDGDNVKMYKPGGVVRYHSNVIKIML